MLQITTAPIIAGIFASIMSCPQSEAVNVKVELSQATLKVNNSKSQHRLAKLRAISNSPHYNGKFPIVSGITDSRIKMEYDLIFSTSTNSILKQSCIFIKDINVRISYSPTMYIAKKHKPNTCKYQQIYDHETKHINVDIDTINRMAPYMQDVAATTAEKWLYPKPVKTSEMESIRQKISAKINSNLQKAMTIMKLHLSEKQKQVDTMKEYNRISESCPNEVGF